MISTQNAFSSLLHLVIVSLAAAIEHSHWCDPLFDLSGEMFERFVTYLDELNHPTGASDLDSVIKALIFFVVNFHLTVMFVFQKLVSFCDFDIKRSKNLL